MAGQDKKWKEMSGQQGETDRRCSIAGVTGLCFCRLITLTPVWSSFLVPVRLAVRCVLPFFG